MRPRAGKTSVKLADARSALVRNGATGTVACARTLASADEMVAMLAR
jgi:hypothetical protein